MSTPSNRAETIVDAALELPPAERGAYLDKVCGDDAQLRQLVEGLLQAHKQMDALGEGPAAPAPAKTIALSFAPTEQPGERIGPYKLLQQLGEGGCGIVYLAEQVEPVRRRVALKVIKPGMDTKQVLGRFEAERQALALMDHPHIAKVFDAGATSSGRPYFVMELVKGIPLTRYCDENKLSTEQRLKLFIQVCQAIQHAHQKGIIHRDIKPTNILAADHDGVPVPKVIDFGVAKATAGQTLTDKTVFTAFEQFIGTPAYMSPEQAMLSGLDIDTRSDIYSLGVLLYELLTGRTPFDPKRLIEAGLDEIRRIIRDEEPPRPSTRFSALAPDEQTTVAGRRQSEPPKLIHLVEGDLDWIAMKCLEKDRTRRYETANGLAMDVQRHLNCEPVVARPPSRLYEFQKTVRRHKFGFAAGAALIMVLAVGVLVSTWQAIRATQAEREQTRLREAAQKAQANEAQLRQLAEDERKRAEMERQRAEKNATEETRQRLRAEGAEKETERKLWESYLAQARANRWSGRAGRRFDSLVALSNAAAIRPALELRNEATACMALTDVRFIRTLRSAPETYMVTDQDHDRYAVLGRAGGPVGVFDSLTDQPVATLPAAGFRSSRAHFISGTKLLAVAYTFGETNFCQVWDTERSQLVLTLTNLSPHLALAFDPRTQFLAVGHQDGAIGLYAPGTNTPLRLLDTPRHSLAVSFQPLTNKLAICAENSQQVTVLDPDNPAKVQTWRHYKSAQDIAWSPDGSLLAVGCDDFRVYLWDPITSSRVALLEGHDGGLLSVFFNHAGTVLVSYGRDDATRFWEPWSGRLLLTVPQAGRGFSLDDQRMVFDSPVGNRLISSLWTFAGAQECAFFDKRRISWLRERRQLPALLQSSGDPDRDIVSPDGRYLAHVDRPAAAVVIADTTSAQPLKRVELSAFRDLAALAFSPDGRWLAIDTASAHRLFSVADWTETLQLPASLRTITAFSPDGNILAVPHSRATCKVIAIATGKELATLESPYDKNPLRVRFSTDGNELAVFYETDAVEVWNLRLIRQQLATMRLDWETPGSPPRLTNAIPRASNTNAAVQPITNAALALAVPANINIPGRAPAAAPELLDLTLFYNVGLTNRWSPSADTNRLSTKTLAPFPRGPQTFGGVRFDVRGLIQLHSTTFQQRGLHYPTSVKNIPVGRPCAILHFLHATAWNETNGALVGHYQVHFEDGESARVPIVYGQDVRDWDSWGDPETRLGRGVTAWRRTNVIATVEGRLYQVACLFKSSWSNPRPGAPIRSLDFVSAGTRAGPFLVAVTAKSEFPSAPRVASKAASLAELLQRRRAALAAAIPPRAPDTPPALIDLSAHYNAALTEDFHARLTTPISVGRTNDLSELPTGVQTLAGTPFDIRGIVHLTGYYLLNTATYPERVDGIKVGRRARILHFFHGAGWQMPDDGAPIGAYILHYTDGTEHRVPIIYGQDVRDWYFWGNEPEKATTAALAWTGRTPHATAQGMSIRLYVMTVESLRPQLEIESVDFISARRTSAPFLIALTAEP